MATANFTPASIPETVVPGHTGKAPVQLHRVRTVRLRQGVSLRSAARQIGGTVSSLRLQEQETTDLRISELQKWQQALDVPLTELMTETDEPLSRPVLERARMIRIMKTVRAIQQQANAPGIERLAGMLAEQLLEVMPELEEVSAWHQFGQRRSSDEFGRVAERCIVDQFSHDAFDD